MAVTPTLKTAECRDGGGGGGVGGTNLLKQVTHSKTAVKKSNKGAFIDRRC